MTEARSAEGSDRRSTKSTGPPLEVLPPAAPSSGPSMFLMTTAMVEWLASVILARVWRAQARTVAETSRHREKTTPKMNLCETRSSSVATAAGALEDPDGLVDSTGPSAGSSVAFSPASAAGTSEELEGTGDPSLVPVPLAATLAPSPASPASLSSSCSSSPMTSTANCLCATFSLCAQQKSQRTARRKAGPGRPRITSTTAEEALCRYSARSGTWRARCWIRTSAASWVSSPICDKQQ